MKKKNGVDGGKIQSSSRETKCGYRGAWQGHWLKKRLRESYRELEHGLSNYGLTNFPLWLPPSSQFVPWWNLLDQQKGKLWKRKDKRYAHQCPLGSCFCCCLLLLSPCLLRGVSHQLVWRMLLNGPLQRCFRRGSLLFGALESRGAGDTGRQARWGIMWDGLTTTRRH